jgi:class 3 adenylate cyclase/pimeloyl-ACP methyl ester carboxylesterase
MEPQHRFCKSADGTEIAYARLGEGPWLVGIFPHLSDFGMMWDDPEGKDFLRDLSSTRTYVGYDRRGTGLSQRDIGEITLEIQVADLEAVIASEGIGEFDAITAIDGCAVLVIYAVRNPGRLRRAIFWSPYARYDFRSQERLDAMVALVNAGGWSIVRKAIADATCPTGSADNARALVAGYKKCVEPDVYPRVLEYETSYDVTETLTQLDVPALVLHRRDSRLVPVAAVRTFASGISQAELVLLDGDTGAPWLNYRQVMSQINKFLGNPAPPAPAPGRTNTLATVLFTDLVGHSEMMTRLGDERGRAVLREHEGITRDVLKAHGGTEVKTMGDGFLASFGSVTKAVECAIALQRAFAEREGEPLAVRVGLNAGEPIEEDGDLFGATVILASRIAAKAGAGEILVADTVRGLCSGKGFLFSDRGEFVAKGFEEPVRVYEVSWRG